MAGGLWLATTRSIVRPILFIWEAVKKMEEGDLKQRAPVTTNDEIGRLAKEFNRMAENLENYYDTMKKRHEVEKEALARASEMKSQFLANVSHELRILKEKSFGELNDKQAQYVEYINSSGSHLLQIINSILDLSKIEAGRMELVLEEFPLNEVLDETMATIRPLAEKRDITLASKEAKEALFIRADRGKFKQVLLNLLSNAVKFNVEKGRVIVDWDITEEPLGNAVERFLVMSVTDTGMGVREEDVEKLFKEFEQLDPTTVKEHGGTGLGLALTKKLVNMHGGHIWVESETGKGCTFTVKFPQGAEKIEGMAAREPFVREGYLETNPCILVCGESRDINHLLEIYLTTENYDIIKAGDGDELLRKARQQKPFAIIMGITIPRKDGWEVLKELKDDPETADIPTVIISSANNKELGFALGAVDYLVKPVNKDILIGSLHRLSFTTREKRGPSKILVVDDEPGVLALLTDILETEGFTVLNATGGEDAIKAAIEKEPDLMILDLMMPGVSGFDVVDRLKEHPTARNIPVIIFTAKELSPEDKRRLGTNIEKIIQKAGFKKQDLVTEIKRLEWAYPEKANLVDHTTNLFNRRYFDIVLSREVSKSERSGHPFSVLLVDIDNFQKFNEENDVAIGDNALSELAGIIKGDLRKADCVTRYGGDAFAVVLPGISKDEAKLVARKLRALVEAHPISTLDGAGVLTVSIALTCPLEDGTTGIAEGLEGTVRELNAEGGNRVSAVRGHSREGGKEGEDPRR
jgi:diguanylate cyclase (GGDEF)-like protein